MKELGTAQVLIVIGLYGLSCRSAPSDSYSRLMVVGGYPRYNEVEIVNLNGGRHCRNMNPAPVEESAVGTFIAGRAIVCNAEQSGEPEGRCYTHNHLTDTWSNGPSTYMNAYSSAGLLMNDDQEWWIAGGDNNEAFVYGTKNSLLFDGAAFGSYPDLPVTAAMTNLVAVNDTHVVLIEGENGFEQDGAWIFNRLSRNWDPLPFMPSVIDVIFWVSGT